MESEKQPTPRQILAKAYRDNGDIGAANYIEGGSDLLPDTQVHLLAIQDALNLATTRAPADLRSALEAETIEKLRDAAALVARAIGVTQMPDGTASALVFSGNDPGPQLEDILSARAAIASLEGHVS